LYIKSCFSYADLNKSVIPLGKLEVFLVNILRIFFALALVVLTSGCPGKVKTKFQSIASSVLREQFYLEPSTVTLDVGQSKQIEFHNAVEPVVFSIKSGLGELSSSGQFTATVPNEVLLKAVDATKRVAYTMVVVSELPSLNASPFVVVSGSAFVAVENGKVPFQFSISQGLGSITAQGEFTAPSQVGTTRIRVTDANGGIDEVDIEIKAQMSLDQSSYDVNAGGKIKLNVSGGVGPYDFAIVGNDPDLGSVSDTGEYTASTKQGLVLVKIEDSLANYIYAVININTGTANGVLAVSPSSVTLGQGQRQKFSVVGGAGPFIITHKTGLGAVDAAQFEYIAPDSGQGSATIEISDSNNNKVVVAIDVVGKLSVATSSTANLVTPDGSLQITPSGGSATSQSDYTYIAERGTVTSSGVYTAPPTSGTDVVAIIDKNGNIERVSIVVQHAFKLLPSLTYVASESIMQFMPVGGIAPYRFEIKEGGGQLDDDGLYMAPMESVNSIIEAVDSAGAVAQSRIIVVDKLSIDPFYKVIVQGQSVDINISEGAPPYVLTLEGANAVGSVSQVSESVARYVAPASVSSRTSQTIKIVDSLQREVAATVVTNPALSLGLSTMVNVVIGGSVQLNAMGGIPPYQLTTTSGGVLASVDQKSSASWFVSALAFGTQVFTLTDSVGSTASLNLPINYPVPLVGLSGLPTAVSSITVLDVTVGGEYLSDYQFAIIEAGSVQTCETATYTSDISINTKINTDISNSVSYPDGQTRICVIGKNLAGVYQDKVDATSFVWTKTTTPSVAIISGVPSGYSKDVAVTASISGSGVESYKYQLVDGASTNCLVGGYSAAYSQIVPLVLNLSGDGPKTLCVISRNQYNLWQSSPSTSSWDLDTSAPTVPSSIAFDHNPSNSLTQTPVITFTASTDAGSGVLKYQARVLKVSDSSVIKDWTDFVSGNALSTLAANLVDGSSYRVEIKAFDNIGNISTAGQATWAVDASQPSVVLSTAVASPTNSASIAVTVTFNEAVTDFALSDLVLTNATASGLAGSGASYSFNLLPSSNGSFDVTLPLNKVIDAAQNANTASNTLALTYDNQGPSSPSILINSGDVYTNLSLVNLALGATDAATMYVTEDSSCTTGGAWESISPTNTFTLSIGEGSRSVYVRFRDSVGNYSSCVSDSISLDTVAPNSPSSLVDGMYVSSTISTASITFNPGSDSGSGLLKTEARIVLASNSSTILKDWSDLSSGQQLTDFISTLIDGAQYVVQMRAVDVAGNISLDISSDGWTVDVSAPTVPSGLMVGSNPMSLTVTPTLSWTSSSDTVSGVHSYEVQVWKDDSTDLLVVDWVSLSNGASLNSGFSLSDGSSYYFKLRARDQANNTSAEVSSTTWTADEVAEPAFSISPSVAGKSIWYLHTDGPLVIEVPGAYTISPLSNFTADLDFWGGAGGGGMTSASVCPATSLGGAGGHVAGAYSFVSGQSYTIWVAEGGAHGNASQAPFGGGGKATTAASGRYAGSGGGLSGIFLNSASQANALMIAAGGGGGSSGAGGGTSQDGTNAGVAPRGQGATVIAAGLGGAHSTSYGVGGASGGALYGGSYSGGSYSGGGGGSGYFGGGSGDTNNYQGAGGGGGSNFISNLVTESIINDSDLINPSGFESLVLRAGAGLPGASYASGGSLSLCSGSNGKILIRSKLQAGRDIPVISNFSYGAVTGDILLTPTLTYNISSTSSIEKVLVQVRSNLNDEIITPWALHNSGTKFATNVPSGQFYVEIKAINVNGESGYFNGKPLGHTWTQLQCDYTLIGTNTSNCSGSVAVLENRTFVNPPSPAAQIEHAALSPVISGDFTYSFTANSLGGIVNSGFFGVAVADANGTNWVSENLVEIAAYSGWLSGNPFYRKQQGTYGYLSVNVGTGPHTFTVTRTGSTITATVTNGTNTYNSNSLTYSGDIRLGITYEINGAVSNQFSIEH
jgi:hypothetical protein